MTDCSYVPLLYHQQFSLFSLKRESQIAPEQLKFFSFSSSSVPVSMQEMNWFSFEIELWNEKNKRKLCSSSSGYHWTATIHEVIICEKLNLLQVYQYKTWCPQWSTWPDKQSRPVAITIFTNLFCSVSFWKVSTYGQHTWPSGLASRINM